MEVLEGYPLDAIIKGKTDLVLDRKTALKIIRQIALALEYAHSKGIIHSDLKPGNIYYTNSGQVKVLDFGIARAINSGRYTDNFDAGALNAITPKYASLEMFERQPPDPRDDIYALGLIAAELLCRKHPYKGEFATEVKAHNLAPEFSNLPGFLYAQWLSKAVRVDRDQRTQSASKFLSQLNWAEKGPLRVTVASLILTLLLVANFYYIESVDTAVPLSELPQAEQQLVRQNLASADQALGFKDYNGALIYLERAYEVHPSNKDIKSRVAKILTDFEAAYRAAPNAEQQAFLAQQLRELADYDFIARNKDYTQLVTTLSTQR
jgi:serine/threonine protein kinase